MTRILFWNIENFSMNKIYSDSLKRKRGHGGLNDAQSAIQRRAVISAVLAATVPDIIVIIEVCSGDNWPNALATQTGGINALAFMQLRLNNPAHAVPGGWNCVPPLYTGTGGPSETVGILYRRTNNAGTLCRYFTGPNIWTGGINGASVPPGGGAVPAPYTGPALPPGTVNVNGMLVPPGYGLARQIPAGAQHNGGTNENLVAARMAFDDTLGAAINFNGLREPFMATFTEATAPPGNAVQRDITIFGIHSPPTNPGAANYLTTLSTMQDVVGPLGANEMRVIGGDFNVNLLNVNGTASAVYNPLIAGPGAYTLLVSPTAAAVPANLDQYQGYFSTHIRGKDKSAVSRFLWSDPGGGGPSSYPGYGYVGSNFIPAPCYSIDNILVWPHQAPPYNYHTTIMNTVVGTPMNGVAAPPDAPPPGSIPLPSRFTAPPAGWPGAPTAAAYPGVGGAQNLTGWSNYGRVRNTSDHFAIFAIV